MFPYHRWLNFAFAPLVNVDLFWQSQIETRACVYPGESAGYVFLQVHCQLKATAVARLEVGLTTNDEVQCCFADQLYVCPPDILPKTVRYLTRYWAYINQNEAAALVLFP